jgi:hypothetical protein
MRFFSVGAAREEKREWTGGSLDFSFANMELTLLWG